MKHFFFLLFVIFLSSCSDGLENLATISVSKVSSVDVELNETTINIELKKGDVIQLWNDMSIETKQKRDVQVNYVLTRFFNGESLGEMNLNALKTNPTILESKEMTRGRMVWNFQGKITELKIEESGKYAFKAAIFTSDSTLILNRANLVFKRKNEF